MLNRCLVVLAALSFLAPSARAAVVIQLDKPALVDSSDLIFHGTVEKVQTRDLSRSTMPRLVTDVKFTVSRVLKGRVSASHFTLRLIGGRGKKHSLVIPGQPRFKKGEEVVLFLEWTGTGYAVCGMGQGKYRVTIDEEDRKVAARSLAGLTLMRKEAGGPFAKTSDRGAEPPVLLEDLFEDIKLLRKR